MSNSPFTNVPCVSFARILLNHVPDSVSILLVPTAVGGSSIQLWLGDSVWREVKLLSNFSEKIKVASDVGIVKAILCHQGESNANTIADIERYPDQLEELVEVFRKCVFHLQCISRRYIGLDLLRCVDICNFNFSNSIGLQ